MALGIVGSGGSLALTSRSRAALRVALDGAASAGAETTLLDLRELALPMYDPDHDEPTEGAARLIESCHAAARVFGPDGSMRDESVAAQLRMLGGEVVRVAERFAADASLHRAAECAEAAERVAAAA